MKKFLFLGACLAALASAPAKAQTGGAEAVVVRLTHVNGNLYISTARGANQSETRTLDVPLGAAKNGAPISEAYQGVLAKMLQQGYSLKGMSGGDDTTTLVFVKEK